jgi:alkylation response protein AidB-like acyl-CoA dehydrogenase
MELNFQVETLRCFYTDARVQRINVGTSEIMKEVIWQSL